MEVKTMNLRNLLDLCSSVGGRGCGLPCLRAGQCTCGRQGADSARLPDTGMMMFLALGLFVFSTYFVEQAFATGGKFIVNPVRARKRPGRSGKWDAG